MIGIIGNRSRQERDEFVVAGLIARLRDQRGQGGYTLAQIGTRQLARLLRIRRDIHNVVRELESNTDGLTETTQCVDRG